MKVEISIMTYKELYDEIPCDIDKTSEYIAHQIIRDMAQEISKNTCKKRIIKNGIFI